MHATFLVNHRPSVQVFQHIDDVVSRSSGRLQVHNVSHTDEEYAATLTVRMSTHSTPASQPLESQVVTADYAPHVPAKHKIRLLLVRMYRLAASVTHPCLMQHFGEHGRELITVEVGLRLLELLADPERLRELPYFANKPLEPMLQLLSMCDIKVRCMHGLI